jgi:hypothetical protein
MGAPETNHRQGHWYLNRDKTVIAAKKMGVGT